MAFMSTSLARDTPIDYMGEDGSNVLWALKPEPETDAGKSDSVSQRQMQVSQIQ